MSWIEGVGDEVTITLAVIAVLCIILVAWISTGIRDIPFIRVVIVQLTRRRQHPAETVESLEADLLVHHPDATSEAEVDNDSLAQPTTQEVPADEAEVPPDRTKNDSLNVGEAGTSDQSEDRNTDDSKGSLEEAIAPENVENLTATQLRQRRLEFFKDPSAGDGRDLVTGQCSESKNNADEKCVKAKLPSNDKSKESEIRTPQQKSLSDLASSLLSSELENSRKEHAESGDRETQSVPRENHSTETETADEIRVRLKYLNDTQRLVKASPSETIGNFRRKHFTTELSESKLVRFIFNGQDLRNDSSTLQACNIIDNSVVHCLITQPQEQPGQTANHQDDGFFDIGMFMFPLFGILLGIVWYLRFMYRQFFNVTSTLTLGGITFLFIAAFMSSLRANRPHQHLE